MSALSGKQIVVGVGGGIAAWKAVQLVRELGRRGAAVRVVMTESAARFVGPVTFTGVTGTPAVASLWDPAHGGEVHVQLGAWAHALLVAPATANLMARAAAGMADDALLATLCCTSAPVLMAPAMHERMWRARSTQRSVTRLREDGVRFVGPVTGPLASGEVGEGRMAEPSDIADALEREVFTPQDLAGVRVLVSAGPTLEDLDPVRFLSNRSSGRMGYALARAAYARGASVALVTGPTSLPIPTGVEARGVRSAREMRAAIQALAAEADVIVMTAAVADYRPAQVQRDKIKKHGARLTVELVKNPDILAEFGRKRVAKRPVLIGFAMETQDVVAYAREKLRSKRADLIVANHAEVGFGRDDTQATLVGHEGDDELPPMTKVELANRILDRARSLLGGGRQSPRPSRLHRRAASPRRTRR